jgi:hypothetical protein
MDNSLGATANGNPVVVYDCNGGGAQVWTWPGDGTVRISGKCLDVTGSANGSKVQLWDCTASRPSQRWTAGPNNTMVNPDSGRCIDNPFNGAVNFTQLQLIDCNSSDAQYWSLTLTITGPIRSSVPVKCVNDPANSAADLTQVQISDCTGGPAQQWTAPGDGTLRINGKCMDIFNAATASTSKIQIVGCTPGNGAQQWISGPANSLRNPASNRCLDDPYASPTNGTQLWIYDCNGGNAQNWTLSP